MSVGFWRDYTVTRVKMLNMHQGVDRENSGDDGLLRAFVTRGSQEAFRALVEKYLGMIRGIAQRRLGDAGLAQEVAQNVFTILARKAKRLRAVPSLSGWIHRVTVIECAEAMRRESTHRTRMRAVSGQLIAEFEGRDVWREALPLLDEAIDALSHGEREVVMLRFFERKTFRQVGAALGKSEDAAQKQCERALQRLSAFLQKRGARVNVAVLGAGLGSLLAQASSAAAVEAMARGAAAAATTFEAKISILKALETMTRTKLNTAILVATVLGVPLAMQWAENSRLREAMEAITQRHEGQTVTDAGHGRGNPVANAQSNERGARRIGIAEQDARARGGAIHNAAEDRASDVAEWKRALFLSDPLQRSQRLAELLSQLRAADGPAIAAGFEEARAAGVQFAEEHRLFLRAWGKIGGLAAVEHAQKQIGDGSAEAVAALGGWATESPSAARAWLETLPENEAKDALVYGLLDGWSTTDFQAAAAYAESRPDSPARDRFRELLLERALRSHGIGAAKDWVQRIPEDDRNRGYKQRAFGDVLQAMLYRDPAAAARWISEMDGRDFVGADPVTNTAVKLAESSPAGALQWLASLKPADLKGVAKGAGTVLQQWAQQDPQAAGSWLQQNTAHPFYDRLALGYVRTVASADRDAAKNWAQTIRDEEMRGKAMVALEPQADALLETTLAYSSIQGKSNAAWVTWLSDANGASGRTLVGESITGTGMVLSLSKTMVGDEIAIESAAHFTPARKNPHPAGAQWKDCARCHSR